MVRAGWRAAQGRTAGVVGAARPGRPSVGAGLAASPWAPGSVLAVRPPGAHAPPLMTEPGAPLRILVVDDHEVVRRGLVSLLDRREQFQVVAEAGTCAEAVAQARRFVPDIVLLDIRLPDASGIEACRLLRDTLPAVHVVFLTSSPDDVDVLAAIVSGARGYVLKQTRAVELVRTLEAVGRGESLFDSAVMGAVLDRIRRIASGADQGEGFTLTAREREILPLIAEGQTNKEIAAAVFLSDRTVKNYVSAILSKLGLTHRAQVPGYVAAHDAGGPGPRRPATGS